MVGVWWNGSDVWCDFNSFIFGVCCDPLRFKIGHYMKMALQTADAAPVRYGPTQRWQRLSFDDEDNLPKDPRQWTREHVAQWISLVTQQHGLPEVPSSRFLMNGKALCLMSLGMFLSRVPLGGKLLYKDFQLRLCAALYGVNH
ncbi:modulator of activity of ets isoform X1 [Tribolium castaneum]